MKTFLKFWARGVSIFAFYFCLSIVIAILACVGEILPPIVSLPLLVIFGPVAIYFASRWLAPDLFGNLHRGWWGKINRKEDKSYFNRAKN